VSDISFQLLYFPQLDALLVQKRLQVEELTASYATIKDAHTTTQTKLANAEELLQTLLTGLTSSGAGTSGGGGYMGQLADAKARLAQATTEEDQCRMQLGMSERELKALEGRWKEVAREAEGAKGKLDAMKADAENFRKKIAESGWNAEREKEDEAALKGAKEDVRRHTEVRRRVGPSSSPNLCMTGTRCDKATPLRCGFQLYISLAQF
jgi:structural maintenance of chromosome 2